MFLRFAFGTTAAATLSLTLALGLVSALPATAQQTTRTPGALPANALTESGEFWVNPANGCSYMRAQVPGHAPTWHLIRNGAVIGLTNARAGCPGSLRGRG